MRIEVNQSDVFLSVDNCSNAEILLYEPIVLNQRVIEISEQSEVNSVYTVNSEHIFENQSANQQSKTKSKTYKNQTTITKAQTEQIEEKSIWASKVANQTSKSIKQTLPYTKIESEIYFEKKDFVVLGLAKQKCPANFTIHFENEGYFEIPLKIDEEVNYLGVKIERKEKEVYTVNSTEINQTYKLKGKDIPILPFDPITLILFAVLILVFVVWFKRREDVKR